MKLFTVDQAGKIESTNEDTILSLCSKEIQYTIRLPKYIKQNIFNQCNKRHKKQIMFRIFSFGLYLLLKNKIDKNSIITIDNEYFGHERDIKTMLLNHLNIKKEQIQFKLLGKDDLSHRIANQTFSGKLRPNEIITEKQLNLKKLIPEKILKEFMK